MREPVVASGDRVLQIGRARRHQVVDDRGFRLGGRARQQLLRSLPVAGREIEQRTLRVRARATAPTLGPQRSKAAARGQGRGKAAQQDIQADEHQREDREGRLEELPPRADRDVTGIGEQQMSE